MTTDIDNNTNNTITPLTDEEEIQQFLAEAFKKKLKKPKKPKSAAEAKPAEDQDQESAPVVVDYIEQQRIEAETWKGFDYSKLLGRVEDCLQRNGINTSKRGEKFSLSTATLSITLKGKKTTFENFDAWVLSVSKSKNATFDLRREHIANYILSEFCCEGVLNSGRLILRGRFNTGKIESLLTRYILAYHRCKCNCTRTLLYKCSAMRAFYNECDNCRSKTYLEDYKIVNHVLVASKEK